jgi:hypothetical protein
MKCVTIPRFAVRAIARRAGVCAGRVPSTGTARKSRENPAIGESRLCHVASQDVPCLLSYLSRYEYIRVYRVPATPRSAQRTGHALVDWQKSTLCFPTARRPKSEWPYRRQLSRVGTGVAVEMRIRTSRPNSGSAGVPYCMP